MHRNFLYVPILIAGLAAGGCASNPVGISAVSGPTIGGGTGADRTTAAADDGLQSLRDELARAQRTADEAQRAAARAQAAAEAAMARAAQSDAAALERTDEAFKKSMQK